MEISCLVVHELPQTPARVLCFHVFVSSQPLLNPNPYAPDHDSDLSPHPYRITSKTNWLKHFMATAPIVTIEGSHPFWQQFLIAIVKKKHCMIIERVWEVWETMLPPTEQNMSESTLKGVILNPCLKYTKSGRWLVETMLAFQSLLILCQCWFNIDYMLAFKSLEFNHETLIH